MFDAVFAFAFGIFVCMFGKWFPVVLVILVVLWLIKMSRR